MLMALEGFTKQILWETLGWCLGHEVIQQPLIALAPPLWLSDGLAAKSLAWTVEYFGGFGVGRLRLLSLPLLTPSQSLLPGNSFANDASRDVMNFDWFL